MSFLERQFKIAASGSTVRTEILSGFTTFVTMSYVIFVNPEILSKTGMDFNALVSATCYSAALATFLMAFMANYPVALASGMGINAFFAFTVVAEMHLSWQVALTAVFIEGIIFLLLTLIPLRETVVNAIPRSLKIGIASGIGLFITFIGLQSSGIIVSNKATLVSMAHLKNNLPAILAIGGFLLMSVLQAYKVRGSLLIGILAVTIAGLASGMVELPSALVAMPPSIGPIFMKFDFSMIYDSAFWFVVFSLFFIDFFDTVGTLVGVCGRGGFIDNRGNLPNAKWAMMADAIGSVTGAMMGTSTVTSFVESASGIAQGARTGLSSVVTASCFLIAPFFTPLVSMVPPYATAPALVIVGVFMMVSIIDLNLNDWTELIPSVLAFVMMPLTYSISIGIEFAVISYVIIKVCTGRRKDVSGVMFFLCVFFIFKECL